ncbi:MAG: M13 family metallopeptidase [Rhizomicrobium sp.]
MNTLTKYVGAPLVGALALLGLGAQGVSAAETGPTVKPWGVDLGYIDNSIKPGADFFAYANNGWLKTDTIPADRSYSGVNLELDLGNEAKLKNILQTLIQKKDPTAEERKLRDLYVGYLDTKAIDKAGLKPVSADLKRIAAAKTHEQIAALIAEPGLPLDGPFGLYIGTDNKHPENYSVNLSQAGLGLADRDYYLRDDKEFVEIRAAYKAYLAKMLTLAGIKQTDAKAAAILKLETEIAKVSWAADERRDDDRTYNPMPVSTLESLAPEFPWTAYFTASHIPLNKGAGERTVIVAEKSAFPKLAKLYAATPVSVWRDYLSVRLLQGYAAVLPTNVDQTVFDFYGKVVQGKTAQLPRETRAMAMVDGAMGEALGKLYVAQYFPPDAKLKAKALVDNLLKAYAADIKTLDWMSPQTRAKALDKLSAFTPKIGYPDVWRDYSPLDIRPGDQVGNARRVSRFEWNREIARLDKPVDRAEWGMTPPTNNAYYNPTMNEIVFPAGILQPPYFDPAADDAVNYGEIGATIGHEISHGFDDQGSKYDGAGVMRDWWTTEDRKNFDARTTALAKQYDAYEPLPGIHINGKLTLGENIADLAGLVIAYQAYHIALGGKPAPVLNGLTGDQRFYIAYAQSWREQWRDGRLRQSLLSNPHSPSKYRVNAVVRNDDGWYTAFDVKPGDTLYLPPNQRVHLW